MLIALVGGKTPVGVLVAAIFFAALETGGDDIDLFTNVPKNIVGVLQGIIILFVSFKILNSRFKFTDKIRRKLSGLHTKGTKTGKVAER